MVILTLCFSPLSGSLFTIRDTFLAEPTQTVKNLGALGLSQDESVRDLSGVCHDLK
jgi:3-methyladenine DNA glycosylase AlkC